MTKLISQEEENGMRLHLLMSKCTEGLLDTFHRSKYDRSPKILYNQLVKENKLKRLRMQKGNRKVISDEQWAALFPCNQETDSTSFDISLLYILLRHICKIQIETYWSLWKTDPPVGDNSLAANIIRIKNMRNTLAHQQTLKMDCTLFTERWNTLSNALLVVSPSKNNDIADIETCVLDIRVANKLRTVETENDVLRKDLARLKAKLNIWWNVFPNVSNFSGRSEDTEKLHTKMKNAANSALFGVAVCGLGGVGKTELAKHYCIEYGMTEYQGNVMWMHANDRNSLEGSFVTLATFLELPIQDALGKVVSTRSIVERVYNYFRDRRCLFVFDNYTYFENLVDFLPASSPSNSTKPVVLATSQYTNWSASFDRIDLEVFSAQSAQYFMKTYLNLPLNEEEVNTLSNLTGNLPLALQQAIAYMNRHSVTVPGYVRLFNENSEKVLASTADDGFYQHTVLTTWKMALHRLLEKENESAMQVIFLMSFMDGSSIRKEIFFDMGISEVDLNEILTILSSYSLISYSERHLSVINMHSLVQYVVRQTAPPSTHHTLVKLLRKQINASESQKFNFGDGWLNHILFVVSNVAMNKHLIEEVLSFRIHIRQALFNKGKYSVCCNVFKRLLEQLNPHLTNATKRISYELRSDMAKALTNLGMYEDAKAEYNNLLKDLAEQDTATRIGTTKFSHLEYSAVCLSIAVCTMYQGNYQQCIVKLEEIRKGALDRFGDDHGSLSAIEELLIVCNMKMGRHKHSLEFFNAHFEDIEEKSRSAEEKKVQGEVLSAEDARVLGEATRVNKLIGKCLFKLKKHGKALEIFQTVDEEREATLGAEHPLTLQDRCNTATCIAQKFNFQRGLEMLRDIEEKQKKIFEHGSHPHILVTRYNIAKTLLKNNRKGEALDLYLKLYDDQCKVFGENHPRVRTTRKDIERCRTRFFSFRCGWNRPYFDQNPLFIEFDF